MNKFNRWLRSKNGIITIAAVLVLVVLVAFVGDRLGWWVIIPRPGATQAYFPPPSDNKTCLPTESTTDGKFLSLPGSDVHSFNGAPVSVWVGVPGQYTQFSINIFDGDSGLDGAGNVNRRGGHWDEMTAESVYTLYADPFKNGATAVKVGEWRGNQLKMADNGWYEIKLPVSADAQPFAGGHYFYRLEARLENPSPGVNAFKLCSDGYLTTGQTDNFFPDQYNAQIGMIAPYTGVNDRTILWPQFVSGANWGTSTYTGEWYFTFPVDEKQEYFEFWNGDFDRGTSVNVPDLDTDDPNTPNLQPFFTTLSPELYTGIRPEGARGAGNPMDNYNPLPFFIRNPAVTSEVRDAVGNVLCTDNNPSGTEEWEVFSMTSNPALYPDADCVLPAQLTPGTYSLVVKGLDMHNTMWLRLPVCDLVDGCGPSITSGTCPRTIGYWKNNVKKVLISHQTNGVQETPESLDKALKFIATFSPLYRSGINLASPAAIADPGVRLTDQEAYVILMRGAQGADYPGDKNTMLARALQQNLASWLNLASGKVGGNTVVKLSRDGSTIVFEGTLWDALQTAQAIMLNPASTAAELERAKEIGDLINNGLLGEDAASSACYDYEDVIPPDEQKPREEFEKPNNPKNENPVPVEDTPIDQTVCTTGNTYNIENTTNNPFYSVKFNAAGGTEISNGKSEFFQFALPKSVVAGMTSMQVEVKAATNSQVITLACDFTDSIGCGTVNSIDNEYSVTFLGATESGDNYILTFQVYVESKFALSHASFELPQGQLAIDPKVGCPAP